MQSTCYKNWPRLGHFTRERTHVPTSSPDRLTRAALYQLVRLKCLVQGSSVPHWSFHHSSHLGALRVTIIWSVVCLSSMFPALTFTQSWQVEGLRPSLPRCRAQTEMSEYSQQLPLTFSFHLKEKKLPLSGHFLTTNFWDFHLSEYTVTPRPMLLLPSLKLFSIEQERVSSRHGCCVKASHHLSSPASRRPCWQTNGRTVYSVKIIWTKINQRGIILLFYSRWLIHHSKRNTRQIGEWIYAWVNDEWVCTWVHVNVRLDVGNQINL